MMKEHKWEDINSETNRLEVPGGWLYRVETRTWAQNNSNAFEEKTHISVVFVPAPQEKEPS